MLSFAPQCPFISMMLMKQIIAVLRNISATASKQYNLGIWGSHRLPIYWL